MAGTATTYILGAGATLSCATTSSGTFTPINQLKQVTFTAAETSFTDITNLSSPSAVAGGPPTKEFAPSVIDPGSAAVTGILVPAGDPGQTTVSGAADAATKLYWELQFAPAVGQTTGAKRTFAGYVKSKPVMDAQLTDAVSFNFNIQISGLITDTPGSSS